MKIAGKPLDLDKIVRGVLRSFDTTAIGKFAEHGWLPIAKYSSLKFLQQILCEEKNVMTIDLIPKTASTK